MARPFVLVMLAFALTACDDEAPATDPAGPSLAEASISTLAQEVRTLTAIRGRDACSHASAPERRAERALRPRRRLHRSARSFVDHYSESHLKLRAFTDEHLEPLLQGTLLATTEEILKTRDPLLEGVVFPGEVIDEVTAFGVPCPPA